MDCARERALRKHKGLGTTPPPAMHPRDCLWGQGQAFIELHVPDVAVVLGMVADLAGHKRCGPKKRTWLSSTGMLVIIQRWSTHAVSRTLHPVLSVRKLNVHGSEVELHAVEGNQALHDGIAFQFPGPCTMESTGISQAVRNPVRSGVEQIHCHHNRASTRFAPCDRPQTRAIESTGIPRRILLVKAARINDLASLN